MTIEEILKLRQEAGGLNKLMHMHVVTLDKDGGATVELDLTPELLNPLGMAHGGTIFTLCDIAAGSAAASQGTVAVTLDSTIHYYRPGRCGKKLTAVAYERKRGRKVSVYMVEVHDDEGKHIADATFTMFYTGATLDDGTKQTLEGLAAVLRSTAKTMGTAGQIKDAKSSICDIIEDTWDEYTSDVNNLLLMDATAEAVSLTDSRNPSPESIQILIRTQEITMPDEDEREAEAAAEVQTTFWGRVAQMFKDFWATITGLFGGKD